MSSLRSLVAMGCAMLLAASIAWSSPALDTVTTHFQNWSTREGLPSNRTRCVTQSRDGFVWIGTDFGATRFDGASFKTYGPQEGLRAPTVLCILETQPGVLWIGTLGGGISILENGVITHTYTKQDGLPSDWVERMEFDAAGRPIVFTPNGMAVFEGGRFQPPSKNTLLPDPVFPRFRDTQGVLWGMTWNQIRHWKDEQWQPDPLGGPTKVSAICEGLEGQIWAYGQYQLWQRSSTGWTAHEIPAEFPRNPRSVNLTCAPDGTVWIAFHRQALYGFRNGRFIVPASSELFRPDYAERIFTTGDGQVWLTSAKGLFRLSQPKILVSFMDDPAATRAANDLGGLLETSPGEFLVATQGSGFYRWKDGHATRLSDAPELGAGVYGDTLYRTSDGTIWLGASSGLFEMRDGQPMKQYHPTTASIWALKESIDGSLWIGAGDGHLFRLKDDQTEPISYGGDKEPIRVIEEEKDGTLWLGTRGNGLFRGKAGEWKRFGREHGLKSELIRFLHLDRDGHLWIGTDGGGLSLFSGDRFLTITSREGLPSDTISLITFDDEGRLWLGSNRGLAVLDQQSVQDIVRGNIHTYHPILISRSDGMVSEDLNIIPPFKTSDGRLAFGTTQGFIRLKPSDFQPDRTRPPVLLERLLADENPVPLTKEKITLSPGMKRIEFEFTGLFFTAPERLKFRNRLVGLESDWIETGTKRSAEYRNLAPGNYRFEVEATTGNGLWSEHPATIEVYVAPHFWQTLWFKAVIAALTIGLVAWIVRHQERKRTQHQIEMLERRQAVDAERARIARDLHDDVGASLTQVALQSQIAERNLTRKPERAQESLKDIFKTAKDMTRALDEIIWAANPSHDTLENFLSFLGVFVQDYAKGAGLRSRFDIPESVPALVMPPTLRHHLYLATKEIMHNIVKHARASEVVLKVTLEGGTCVILLSDNGCGFIETPSVAGADGLINLRNRLEQLRGECIRRSTPGQGTSVEMRIPMDWGHG